MTDELKNTDPEDIEDLLVKVETSFGISFAENELAHIKTFGELSDHVSDKIQLDKSDDCTEVVQKNGTLFCIKNAENGRKKNQEIARTLRA